MTKLSDYMLAIIGELGNDKSIDLSSLSNEDTTVLVAYELSNLTDAVYKLIDKLEEKKNV